MELVDNMILVTIWRAGESDLTTGQTWTIGFVTPALRFTGVASMSGGQIRSAFVGEAGQSVVIKTSSDLVNWQTAATVVLDGAGEGSFEESASSDRRL